MSAPTRNRRKSRNALYCATGKIHYRTIEAALEALAKTRAKGLGSDHAYVCRVCNGWHLTSKPSVRKHKES